MLPRGWDRRTIVLLTFALLALISTNLAHTQVFDLERDRVSLVELNGFMRFHTGDDPRWADPKFDDSQWKLLRPDQPWSASGERDEGGMAWYRFIVRVPASLHQPVLYLPAFAYSMEVFADGELIGSNGRFPPHQRVETAPYLIFTLPNGGQGGRNVVIAIRAWTSWSGDQIGPAPMRIGSPQYIDQIARLTILELYWDLSGSGYLILVYLIGSGALLLFWLRPREREYLWFGAYELGHAVFWSLILIPNFLSVSSVRWQYAGILAYSLKDWIWILFLQAFVKRADDWSFLLARTSIVAIAAVNSLVVLPFFYGGVLPDHFDGWIYLSMTVLNLGLNLGLLYPLFRAARARSPDAGYLFIAFGLYRISVVLNLAHWASQEMGWTGPWHWMVRLSAWPFPIGVLNLSEIVTQLAMLGMLALRFARSRRDEEHAHNEIQSARSVQQVLIPEEIPAIPGFRIDCVYQPAGQVGGDFFQILPTSNNGALVVIGDVSGKGMPAAMAVSLLVGTVRTLAHYTQGPGEILTAMNQRMLGRSKDGFTTCLVLRLDPDGSTTVANAGHLAPYLGATEVPVEGGLPLGLAAQAEYTESSFHLDNGGEITLLTDGVAEARAKTGELFGFERAASIATLSAAHIAATAAAFGQQDDITVLKIRRCPVLQPALAGSAALPSISTNPA
jgi:Stage II sporulation protein E (SpoIIE)